MLHNIHRSYFESQYLEKILKKLIREPEIFCKVYGNKTKVEKIIKITEKSIINIKIIELKREIKRIKDVG